MTHHKPIPGGQTYGFSKGRTAIYGPKYTQTIMTSGVSAQCSELIAVIHVLQLTGSDPINIVCESASVVNLASHIETTTIKCTLDPELLNLFLRLQQAICTQEVHFHISHIFSHTKLPGPVSLGNDKTDKLIGSVLQQAQASHELLNQNNSALTCMFHLSHSHARAIIQACPNFKHVPRVTPIEGCNP